MSWTEKFREDLKGCPWPVVELLIANIIVGEMSPERARAIGRVMQERQIKHEAGLKQAQENLDGAGI